MQSDAVTPTDPTAAPPTASGLSNYSSRLCPHTRGGAVTRDTRGTLGAAAPLRPRGWVRGSDNRELSLAGHPEAARDEYAFRTADGVCSPDAFRTAELLLAETLWGRARESVLVPDANYGVTGVLLADGGAAVTMTEASARAAALCERNADRNGTPADSFVTADPGCVPGVFDTVAYAPKPYESLVVAKQRLVNAAASLEADGSVVVAATEAAGANRFASLLRDCAGTVERVTARDGCRVLEAQEFGDFDPPAYVTPSERRVTVGGVSLSLVTVPGVFAASGLDHGTRLLLETAEVGDGDRVLDLCCGYGAVGAYAASVADCEVVLTDDDRTATRCAEGTLAATGVCGEVVTADCTAGVAGESFDRVLCNPPTHAGSGVLRALFEGARDVLASGGRLWVVHHRDLDLRQYWPGREEGVVATGDEHVVLELR
jgi:23S rRNA (guanine1835-N2)-methyltransferase